MVRRIAGQCNTSDFKHLECLSDAMSRGIKPDLTNLTNRQKMAVMVLDHFQRCGVKFEVLLKIKEVLVWEPGYGETSYEYKLLRPGDRQTASILQGMRPIRGGSHETGAQGD